MSTAKTQRRSGDTFVRDGRRFVVVSVSGPPSSPEVRSVREGSHAHQLAMSEIAARRARP